MNVLVSLLGNGGSFSQMLRRIYRHDLIHLNLINGIPLGVVATLDAHSAQDARLDPQHSAVSQGDVAPSFCRFNHRNFDSIHEAGFSRQLHLGLLLRQT